MIKNEIEKKDFGKMVNVLGHLAALLKVLP